MTSREPSLLYQLWVGLEIDNSISLLPELSCNGCYQLRTQQEFSWLLTAIPMVTVVTLSHGDSIFQLVEKIGRYSALANMFCTA